MKSNEETRESKTAVGIGLGTAIGAALGTAMNNLAIGIAIGIAIGAALGSIATHKTATIAKQQDSDG